jgi:hypothetical protein
MFDHKCVYSQCPVIIPAGDRRIYHSKACRQAAYRERLAVQTPEDKRLARLQKELSKNRDSLAALVFDFTEEGCAEYDQLLITIRQQKDAIMEIHTARIRVIEAETGQYVGH